MVRIDRPGLLLPLTMLVAFVLSALAPLAMNEGSWLYRNGWIYWLLLIVGGDVAVILLLNSILDREPGPALRATTGALLLATILVAAVLGLVSPYALGVGSRGLDDFSKYSEMPWERLLAMLLASVVVLGGVLGALTGLLSGRSAPQRPSP